ncbi:MAG: NAD-dependent epimerase/dehydratase family protein [Chloroflexi bacterium]|nr:NAD-dependent epimerase/dehydratase family protein [Chloroflexota bacterium]
MSTILVTGGGGFIGSHIAKAFIATGHRVVIVDDLSSGRRELVPPQAAFYQMDIRDPAIEKVFQEHRPDVVDHHAAQISVSRSMREPRFDAEVNVVGSVNLLDIAARHGVKRFIFASTGGALYGEPERLPCGESHPIAPLSPYGTAKYAVEQYVRYFKRAGGLPFVILRYGNVYGPDQDPHGEAGVVAIFALKMLRGQEVTVFGDGTQQRDFIYVGDVAQANVSALERGEGGAYNIGTGRGDSVNEVYRVLAAATGYTKPPVYLPARPGDVYRIWLNCSLAKRELGWQAATPLEEGLRRTVEAIRKRRNSD